MSFETGFADALRKSGIELSAADVPSQDVVEGGLAALKSWIDSLDKPTREAADAVTAEFPAMAGLADPEVNIAPGLSALLRAADKTKASRTISQVLAISSKAFALAAERGGQV